MNERLELAMRMMKLASILNRPRYQIVGLIECLWLYVSDPDLDGFFDLNEEELKAELGWEGDTNVLFSALEASGWIKESKAGYAVERFSSNGTWWGRMYSSETCPGCGEPQ